MPSSNNFLCPVLFLLSFHSSHCHLSLPLFYFQMSPCHELGRKEKKTSNLSGVGTEKNIIIKNYNKHLKCLYVQAAGDVKI